MSMEAYQDLLQQTSRLRSISIDADGDFYLRATALEGMSQLEVKVDPKILSPVALSDNFEATTPLIPVPLSMAVVTPLIDPVRWGDFSDSRPATSQNAKASLQARGKGQSRRSFGGGSSASLWTFGTFWPSISRWIRIRRTSTSISLKVFQVI